jgi:hypothetical protein
MHSPEKYRVQNKCEDCAELVIKIITNRDTLMFVKQGQTDNKTMQIILSTRNLFNKMVTENSGNTIFETRGLIKPKPPAIIPVSF